MRKLFFVFAIMWLLTACAEKKVVNDKENQDALLMSVLWFQRSAEMKAVYLQCYNYATEALSRKIEARKSSLPAAVIMDIDETVLDNSPAEVAQIIHNLPFSDSLWLSWVKRAEAEILPGAAEFIRFAKDKGVEVFYVTNREAPDEYLPTIENLKRHDLPFADSIHLILKSAESSKAKRRAAIAEKYDILLLIGDNLADLGDEFDSRDGDYGFGAVERNRSRFGSDLIVLPNPMYGYWINAALKGIEGGSQKERILKVLKE